MLIGLMGLPGAGKSTLARALSDRLGIVVFSREAILRAMFATCRDSAAEKAAAQDALWIALRTQLRLGGSAIVDGMSFAAAAPRAHLRGLAQAYGARYLPVMLDCPLKEALRRVAAEPVRGDRSTRRVRQVAARFAPSEPGSLVLDARASVDVNLARILATLAAR